MICQKHNIRYYKNCPECEKLDTRRSVYFVQRTVTDQQGNYIPCIAVEGERGFYRCEYSWTNDYKQCQELCNEKNAVMGYTPQEAMLIQLSTMRL
jgi:hypothetical protein